MLKQIYKNLSIQKNLGKAKVVLQKTDKKAIETYFLNRNYFGPTIDSCYYKNFDNLVPEKN